MVVDIIGRILARVILDAILKARMVGHHVNKMTTNKRTANEQSLYALDVIRLKRTKMVIDFF